MFRLFVLILLVTSLSKSAFAQAEASKKERILLGLVLDSKAEVTYIVGESTGVQLGLQLGDQITSLNNTNISNGIELRDAMTDKIVGNNIAITFMRDGQVQTTATKLTKIPACSEVSCLRNQYYRGLYDEVTYGKNIIPVSTNTMQTTNNNGLVIEEKTSVIVIDIPENSSVEKSDLQKGDIIIELNGTKVNNGKDVNELLADAKVGDMLQIVYRRDCETKSTSFEIEEIPDYFTAFHNNLILPYYGRCKKIDIANNNKENEVLHPHDYLPTSCHEHETQSQTVEIVANDEDVQVFENILKEQVETDQKTILPTLLGIQKMNIYPNPNDGKFVLKFNASSPKSTTIRILNLAGQSIYEQNLADFEGSYQQEIDITKHTQGLYLLQIVQGNEIMVRKIVVQ
jgi:membrane-associated protease RseP (regulator of RpoE activity)